MTTPQIVLIILGADLVALGVVVLIGIFVHACRGDVGRFDV